MMLIFWHALKSNCLSLILTTLLLFTFYGQVQALQLKIGNTNAIPGDSITVEITVGDYSEEKIAGAVFTLSHNTEHITLANIESDFFDIFSNQWNILDPVPDPMPPSSVIVGNQTFTQPLLFNTLAGNPLGKTLLAAARVKAGTPATLFTLHFMIKASAPPGIYPIFISPTLISNTDAGYDALGEALPLLVDAIEDEQDPAKAYPSYLPVIVNGAVYIQTTIVDSDNDGIDDNWEMKWFLNLTTATQTSDFDKDGYTDLQEYLNGAANLTDPEGLVYNPTLKNAPGGTGYTPVSSNSAFWLMMLPAIINGN